MILQAINYLCNLINIDTTVDSGNQIKAAKYISKVFNDIGITNEVYETNFNKANICATIKGKSDETVLLYGHLDTAPFFENDLDMKNWKFPANKATIFNNCVVGRGALDCKGLIAIWMLIIKNIFENKKTPKKTIIFLACCDEESQGEFGLNWIVNNTDILKNVELVLSEGGGYPVSLDSNYYFTIQTEEITKDLHPQVPCKYSDDDIENILENALNLNYYNENTLEFFYNRHLQGKRKMSERSFYENIDKLIDRNIEQNKSYNYKYLFNLIESKLKIINDNYKLLPIITPGYSDNKFFRENNITTLGFFPLDIKNNISGIHSCNEYISFKSIELAYTLLSNIIYELIY